MSELRASVTEALSVMARGLKSVRKTIDADMVEAYMIALERDDLEPLDVREAARSFLRDSDGSFPASSQFRNQCLRAKRSRVDGDWSNARQTVIEEDPMADDDEWIPTSEAKAIINAALNRMAAKFKDNPLTRAERRDVKREIARMKSA